MILGGQDRFGQDRIDQDRIGVPESLVFLIVYIVYMRAEFAGAGGGVIAGEGVARDPASKAMYGANLFPPKGRNPMVFVTPNVDFPVFLLFLQGFRRGTSGVRICWT